MPVSAVGGTLVPLGAISTITYARAPTAIEHRDQLPAVDISIAPAPGVSLGEAVDATEAAVSQLGLPSGVRGGFQGNAKAFQTSIGSQPWLIFAAILVVYIVLGVLYESFIHPLTILSTLPSAGLGALLTVWAVEHELNLISMVGLILLVGIVKKPS
jgi:multidrug efflux pump subunit AcrB